MFKHSAKTIAPLLVVTGLILTGCATNDERHASNDPCPPNKTLVCQERMGQVEECKCHSKATMRDIFDLRHNK